MKRLSALIFAALMLFAFVGCSDSASDDKQKDPAVSATESSPEDKNQSEVDLSFKAPAELYTNPEDAGLRFTYDEQGRVLTCAYTYNGAQIVSSYSYKENQLSIYSFKGDTLLNDTEITLSGEFDSAVGFTAINGFYVKGYSK